MILTSDQLYLKQWTPTTLHQEVGACPQCHTFSFILSNLTIAVVIVEWHMVEVLISVKHTRQTGIDAVYGDLSTPEGKKVSLVSMQIWGSKSATAKPSFLTITFSSRRQRFSPCV